MKFHLLLAVGAYLIASGETQGNVDINKRLKQCSSESNSFDVCLSALLEDIRPFMKQGLPNLNLPVLEPIFWDNLEFAQKNNSVDINAKFTKVFVHGLSNFTLRDLRSDLQKGELRIQVYIPALEGFGNYFLKGKIMFFKLNGEGTFTTDIHDVDAGLVSKIVVKTEAGKERLGVQNTRINFRISRARSHLDNLFNGDEVLGDIANHFLNSNDRLIINELKPFLSQALAELIETIVDRAIGTIPVSLLPTLPK